MSSAPCFGQTHRIQSGEGVREDQHEVAQVVRTQESRAAPHHRSLQASKSPTLALIAAMIKHRTDGVPARLACGEKKRGNFGRSMESRIQAGGSRGRAARPAGSARSSDGRWRRVVRRGRGRCPLDASGGVRPRSRTIDERKKECRVEARGGCALNPPPRSGLPRPRFSLLT